MGSWRRLALVLVGGALSACIRSHQGEQNVPGLGSRWETVQGPEEPGRKFAGGLDFRKMPVSRRWGHIHPWTAECPTLPRNHYLFHEACGSPGLPEQSQSGRLQGHVSCRKTRYCPLLRLLHASADLSLSPSHLGLPRLAAQSSLVTSLCGGLGRQGNGDRSSRWRGGSEPCSWPL